MYFSTKLQKNQELQRKMQEVTAPEDRKQLARRINELFA
jgi:hypothetical protein